MKQEAGARLRCVSKADEGFLFDLFRERRLAEFAALPAAQAEGLLRMQFRVRNEGYRSRFPESGPRIVVVGGERAGTLWTAWKSGELHLIDIAVLERFQRQGVGRGLVGALIAEARGQGGAVVSSVAKSNAGSLRFHEKLGFVIFEQDAMYWRLRAE